MDVFTAVEMERAYLRHAVLRAAHQLGLLGALDDGPLTVAELASRLRLPPRRLRALVDVLVLEQALVRDGAALRLPDAVPPSPSPPPLPPGGWGELAAVLRRDRPLDEPGVAGTAGPPLERFHRHLAEAGAAAAAELAARFALPWPGAALLDAGGGIGAYTAAFLDAAPTMRATLVDRPAVLALAEPFLSAVADRVSFVAADLEGPLPDGPFDVILCANLLHLLAPDACARLVARLAATLAPGGALVIKDLLVEPDRNGPPSGLLFALNMALYTDGGDVYDPLQLAAWLEAAGLTDVERRPLAAAPDAVVVSATMPR